MTYCSESEPQRSIKGAARVLLPPRPEEQLESSHAGTRRCRRGARPKPETQPICPEAQWAREALVHGRQIVPRRKIHPVKRPVAEGLDHVPVPLPTSTSRTGMGRPRRTRFGVGVTASAAAHWLGIPSRGGTRLVSSARRRSRCRMMHCRPSSLFSATHATLGRLDSPRHEL